MNNEPWFNLDSESARLYEKMKDAEQTTDVKAYPELGPTEPDCQQPDDDYIDVGNGVMRIGNNRKKIKGLEAKARRKMAKKSKQRNRK